MTKYKTLKVILQSITYGGNNIGSDLEFEFFMGTYGEAQTLIKTKIKNGDSKRFDKLLLERQITDALNPFELPISVKCRERDKIEDQFGETNELLIIPFDRPLTQDRLSPEIIAKGGDEGKVATFDILIKAELSDELSKSNGTQEGEEEDGFPSEPTGFPPEPLINPKNKKLLAFMSDLHVGAQPKVDDFQLSDDHVFKKTIDWLIAISQGKILELVLLGDTFEIWEATPKLKSNSELKLSEDFINQRKEDLKSIFEDITERHTVFFESLKKFQASGNRKVTFIRGNHDDEIITKNPDPIISTPDSPIDGGQLLNEVVNKRYGFTFSLAGDSYSNRFFNLSAEHGHSFDDFNNTRDPTGDKPGGRNVVEDLVVKAEKFIDDSNNKLSFPLDNIDSFTPQANYLDYLNCLIESGRFAKKNKKILDEYANDLADKLIARRKVLPSLIKRLVLENGVDVDIDGVIDKVKSLSKNGTRPNKDDAIRLLGITSRKCVLMGHTHQPVMRKISGNRLSINTGTWQDSQRHNPANPCFPINQPNRHVTLLILEEKLRNKSVVHAFMFSMGSGEPVLIASESYKV